jgi:transcriptional regulator with XRE-family HTH domain
MNTQFDIERIFSEGRISNELDYERALIADRKLRVLAKNNPKFRKVRSQLRDLIEYYEASNWVDTKISQPKVKESDLAELIAEKERVFIKRRKDLIKARIKDLGLTQQQLGILLGHKSKTYMSELMNGISPFTMNDLVIINRILKIGLTDLVPTTLSLPQRVRIKSTIKKLGNTKVKLSPEDFDMVHS